MSLINEALRKARHEAARQDAARRGLSYPSGEQPPARLPLVPILAVVALVAIAGGLVYWLGLRSARSGVEVATATPDPVGALIWRGSAPISEQAILGAAMGAAMTGIPVISEIMFSDFLAVCWDMIANEVAKSR